MEPRSRQESRDAASGTAESPPLPGPSCGRNRPLPWAPPRSGIFSGSGCWVSSAMQGRLGNRAPGGRRAGPGPAWNQPRASPQPREKATSGHQLGRCAPGTIQGLQHSSAVSPHEGGMLAKKTEPVVAMTSNRYNQIIYSWILQVLKCRNSIPEMSFGAAGVGGREAQ